MKKLWLEYSGIFFTHSGQQIICFGPLCKSDSVGIDQVPNIASIIHHQEIYTVPITKNRTKMHYIVRAYDLKRITANKC